MLRAGFERVFNMSVDMICVVGFDGYFKRFNPALIKNLGYTEEEISSKPVVEFIHPEDREHSAKEAEKIAKGVKTLFFENRYICKDGSCKWFSWNVVPVIEEASFYCVVRDITDR